MTPTVTFTEGLPEHWEARLTKRRLFGWTVEGWYSGPDIPYPAVPEQIVYGFCWTEQQAREQIVYWCEGADSAPHEQWMPLRDDEDDDLPADSGKISAALLATLALAVVVAAAGMAAILIGAHGTTFSMTPAYWVTSAIVGAIAAFGAVATADERRQNVVLYVAYQAIAARRAAEDVAAEQAAQADLEQEAIAS